MIVQQKYVGWLGVIVGDIVVNSGISFKASCTAKSQLLEVTPNHLEVESLLNSVKKNHGWAKEHIEELERYLTKSNKIGKAHA